MADQLSKSFIYRNFRKTLTESFGPETADAVWLRAGVLLGQLAQKYPHLDRDSRMMILPAAALLTSLRDHAPEQALPLLKEYGAQTGARFASFIHAFTSFPGMPALLWRNMPRLMRTMSSPEKGYSRRIVSETNELVGVDILSCPLYDAALELGIPEAAQVVCAMDKAYMTGFRHIRYTRTTSVAEGAECCDYRLEYDKTKK